MTDRELWIEFAERANFSLVANIELFEHRFEEQNLDAIYLAIDGEIVTEAVFNGRGNLVGLHGVE